MVNCGDNSDKCLHIAKASSPSDDSPRVQVYSMALLDSRFANISPTILRLLSLIYGWLSPGDADMADKSNALIS